VIGKKLESVMKKVNVEITNRGAVYVNDTRITGRHTKWGVHNVVCRLDKIRLDSVRQAIIDAGYGHIRLDDQYCEEMGI